MSPGIQYENVAEILTTLTTDNQASGAIQDPLQNQMINKTHSQPGFHYEFKAMFFHSLDSSLGLTPSTLRKSESLISLRHNRYK